MERLRRRTSGVLDVPVEQEGDGSSDEHGGAKDPDNEHPDHTRKLMAARCEDRRRRSDDCGDDEIDLQPSHETRIGWRRWRLKLLIGSPVATPIRPLLLRLRAGARLVGDVGARKPPEKAMSSSRPIHPEAQVSARTSVASTLKVSGRTLIRMSPDPTPAPGVGSAPRWLSVLGHTLAVVFVAGFVLLGAGWLLAGYHRGGDTFPARFVADGDHAFSPGQSVEVQPGEAELTAGVRIASRYGSSADGGHADRYRFEMLTFRLAGTPATTAAQMIAPHADARGSAADGSYSDESAWIYQYAVTFPKSAVDFDQDVTLLVDGCTASRQCDRLRLPLCLGQKAAGPVLTYTDRENACGPSTRAPLLR